ncbi:MAG TPA: CDP-alcohol phosphatidyltransferase family protein [Lapillicoccus sp.]|nr:CDP-alcohol phosphatidyltransferase family protein [Lapillicoccus sp.]
MSVPVGRRPGVADYVTIGNALCGLAAIAAATGLGAFATLTPTDRYRVTVLFVIIGTVLDMLDGMAARRWGSTPLGPFLDGLADAVTFGVAPVVAVLALPIEPGAGGWVILAAGAAAYAAAALVRLADYLAHRQRDVGFRGVPTTSASIAALALGVLFSAPVALGAGLAALAALMVSPLPYPSGTRLAAVIVPGWVIGLCALFGVFDQRVCAVLVLVIICVVVPLGTRARGFIAPDGSR